ncbi:hypothetical protein MRB53_042122 [Persea americana]|nr:hypothetical protein MRB53_042122 [Persea americana]
MDCPECKGTTTDRLGSECAACNATGRYTSAFVGETAVHLMPQAMRSRAIKCCIEQHGFAWCLDPDVAARIRQTGGFGPMRGDNEWLQFCYDFTYGEQARLYPGLVSGLTFASHIET